MVCNHYNVSIELVYRKYRNNIDLALISESLVFIIRSHNLINEFESVQLSHLDVKLEPTTIFIIVYFFMDLLRILIVRSQFKSTNRTVCLHILNQRDSSLATALNPLEIDRINITSSGCNKSNTIHRNSKGNSRNSIIFCSRKIIVMFAENSFCYT
jgi:hypothetical protein